MCAPKDRVGAMLREFFCSGSPRSIAFAWCGLVLVVVHGLFRAWVKWRLNQWYQEFYDMGGRAAGVAIVAAGDSESGSGMYGENEAQVRGHSEVRLPRVLSGQRAAWAMMY